MSDHFHGVSFKLFGVFVGWDNRLHFSENLGTSPEVRIGLGLFPAIAMNMAAFYELCDLQQSLDEIRKGARPLEIFSASSAL